MLFCARRHSGCKACWQPEVCVTTNETKLSRLDHLVLHSVRWIGLTLSLTALSTGCGWRLFLVSMWKLQPHLEALSAGDDWLIAMLPIGWLGGLLLGLWLHRQWWIHAVRGLVTIVLVWLCIGLAKPNPVASSIRGLPASISNAIGHEILFLIIVTVVASIIVCGIAAAMVFIMKVQARDDRCERANSGRIAKP
jgi:hypothetical protein